jgi:hypothetical protein
MYCRISLIGWSVAFLMDDEILLIFRKTFNSDVVTHIPGADSEMLSTRIESNILIPLLFKRTGPEMY